jgi:hypothetical protein
MANSGGMQWNHPSENMPLTEQVTAVDSGTEFRKEDIAPPAEIEVVRVLLERLKMNPEMGQDDVDEKRQIMWKKRGHNNKMGTVIVQDVIQL